jgi:nucleoside 2-deoxyribosyltransferase
MNQNKLVYVASASRGGRASLKEFSDRLCEAGFFVFMPCLGFSGVETPEVRAKVMRSCFSVVEESDVFIAFFEGVESFGMWEETIRALAKPMPVAAFVSGPWKLDVNFTVFRSMNALLEWLRGLS